MGGDRRGGRGQAHRPGARRAGPADRRPGARAPGRVVRSYSRGTIDRWLRAWRKGGLAALKPAERADTGTVRAHPELFGEASALRLELPGRSAAQIASILYHRHGISVSERTVRGQLRRAGLHREALAAEPKTYGRYEAARPNERWITDVLVGPWVPWPRREGSVRARLFLIVDDHSRLLVDGRFFAHENARACQDLLRRAITRRGVPKVLYADNGAPFSNAWLTRTCGVLGIRLVHGKPYSPEGRGKQERLNRYIREAFLAEATHHGIESLDALNDLFAAWAGQVANRRVHAETGQTRSAGSRRAGRPARPTPRCCGRRSAGRSPAGSPAPPRSRWKATATPWTRPSSAAAELRYDPEDLTRIDVFLDGKPAGAATPFIARRHVHRAVPQATRPDPDPTGIDDLAWSPPTTTRSRHRREYRLHQLGKPGSDPPGAGAGGGAVSPAPWAASFGLARTVRQSIPARDLFPARPTPRRSPDQLLRRGIRPGSGHGDVGRARRWPGATVAGLDPPGTRSSTSPTRRSAPGACMSLSSGHSAPSRATSKPS